MPDPVQLLAPLALLPHGWEEDVRIEVDAEGVIVSAGAAERESRGRARRLEGPVVPGMPNLHSHAFQRAMAGLTERRASNADNFWTWRETMYRFVSLLTPEQIEAIATQLFVEMLEAGYTAVAEFHYLHHDQKGRPYADPAETSRRIVAASRRAGIRLTHLPVLYEQGGFGGVPLLPEQKRFANGADGIIRLIDALSSAYAGERTIRIGVAIHSLRAASPQALRRVVEYSGTLGDGVPIHLHVAEQTREVEECVAHLGSRPVEWLFDNAGVDQRWCLVHATHVDEAELEAVAASRAVAGLCPSTEANLGDGVFPAAEYLRRGGRFGIGSDSHVSVSPVEELRLLEYGQRLVHRRRAVLASGGTLSTGRSLFESAARGGAQALGVATGELRPGALADFIVLDADHPALYGRRGDTLLDAALFSGNGKKVKSVWVGGREVVAGGAHPLRDEALAGYRSAVDALARKL